MAIGLQPVRYKSGAPYNGAANTYYVPDTDVNAMFIGDPVLIAGSGDVNGVSSVTLAAAGDRITGVIVGFTTNPNDTTDGAIETGYKPASTEAYVLVADDPSLLFEAQADAAMAAADIGLNADLVAAAGSTVTKKSGYLIDDATKATTTAQVRIVGFSQRVNNTVGSADAVMLVSIVENTEAPDTGVTGI
jgi:hypothetical protein